MSSIVLTCKACDYRYPAATWDAPCPNCDLSWLSTKNDRPDVDDVRSYHVGKSDYSKRRIQSWDIWEEYKLNPWDADIVKRTLREKEEAGMSPEEARILDYEKIKHVCDERIRQLREQIANA